MSIIYQRSPFSGACNHALKFSLESRQNGSVLLQPGLVDNPPALSGRRSVKPSCGGVVSVDIPGVNTDLPPVSHSPATTAWTVGSDRDRTCISAEADLRNVLPCMYM
jgi:hypothetical protein